MFCYYVFDAKQLLSLGTQQGIFWWFMTKMKQLSQIQELHSMTCFLDDHSDKMNTNMFAICNENVISLLENCGQTYSTHEVLNAKSPNLGWKQYKPFQVFQIEVWIAKKHRQGVNQNYIWGGKQRIELCKRCIIWKSSFSWIYISILLSLERCYCSQWSHAEMILSQNQNR